MKTEYGLSVNAEGSAQKSLDYSMGQIPVEANIQAKGFLNHDYKVTTQYEVTLWRWEVVVHGSAAQMEWQMNLHSPDREKQNAYHEFFIVMQAEEGVPFKLDWLEVGGSVKKPKTLWFDEHRSLSSAVTGLVLRKPPMPEKGGLGGKDTPPGDDGDATDPTDPAGSGDGNTTVQNHYGSGCAVGGAPRDAWFLPALGLFFAWRRRRAAALRRA
jgi:MYXO-CTERM domain-containing protein